VYSQEIFKSQVISKLSRHYCHPAAYHLLTLILDTWNCGFACACNSFYDASTYLIFNSSNIIGSALKPLGDYTLKMLVQRVSHLRVVFFFGGGQNKNFAKPHRKWFRKTLEIAL